MYIYGPNTGLSLKKGTIIHILNIKGLDNLPNNVSKFTAEPYMNS
jgi:hypothetical protein